MLNGKLSNSSVLTHTTIINGGKLDLLMNDKLDEKSLFGKTNLLRPQTKITDKAIVQSPIINGPAKITETEKTVTIEHPDNKAIIYYTLDGTEPKLTSKKYVGSFMCDTSTTIKAKAFVKNESSTTTTAHLYKKPNQWKISIQSAYNKQYDAGGDEGIIDGQHGTTNWRSGGWQGYQGQDFTCVLDLGKSKMIEFVHASFLQDTRSWIIFPKQVEYSVSVDGTNYKTLGTIENGISADDYNLQMRTFYHTNSAKLSVRYIKIKATNFGKLPDWHQGKGGDAFIFIDEIDVR